MKKNYSFFTIWIRKHCILVFFLVILGGFLGWQISLDPSQNRNWRAENEFMPSVLEENDTFTISFFRDFYTDTENKLQKSWKVHTFKYSELEEISLGLSHFAEFEGAAHTFLHFKFSGGINFSYSVEARMEIGEKYSPWKGLFRQNELYAAVGTDRDIIGRRAGIKNEKVFIYPLNISKEKQQIVLKTVLNRINEIEKNPEFYNTLTDNCTTSLVGIAEEVKGENIWWTVSHLVPGYFDKKVFEMGLFKNPQKLGFENFKTGHRVGK